MSDQPVRLARFFVALLLALLAPVIAHADSWALPEVETYAALDGSARFTVTPRALENQLAYFEDKVGGREPAGQARASSRRRAEGKLELRQADGSWRIAWEGPLVNEVGPVSALVAPGGGHIVTFDNWHSTGMGDNVVVIYDRAGRLVRSLKLDDLLPGFIIDAMPRTVSSIQWSGEHRLSDDGRQLILQVVMPSPRAWQDEAENFELPIDLATGQSAGVAPPLMARLASGACEVLARNRVGRTRWLAFRREPLLAPASSDEREWGDYLQEAFQRLVPAEPERVANTTILRDPGASNYEASREWLREALRERIFEDLAFASPSQRNLAAELVRQASRLRRNGLRGVTIWIVVGSDLWPQLEQALAPSGARLVRIDPIQPIPQRPERIPDESAEPRFPAECEGRSAG